MNFFIAAFREVNPDNISQSIMDECQTNYSHIGIIVENILGKPPILYQATAIGFHEKPLSEFMPGHEIIHKVEVFPRESSYALGWLDGCIGTEYGTMQLPAIKFKWLRKIPLIKNLFSNKRGKVICCEVAIYFVQDTCDFYDPEKETRDPDFENVKAAIEYAKLAHGVDRIKR